MARVLCFTRKDEETMTMAWLKLALGNDGGLAKIVKLGDRCRHIGTKQWGVVLEVHPQRDGTAELVLEREKRFPGDDEGRAYWATYHIGDYEPKDG